MLSQAIAGKTESQLERLGNPNITPPLRAICTQCLHGDASQRPRDAGQVAEAITRCLEGTQKSLEQARLKQHAAEVQAAEERKRRKAALAWSAGIIAASLLGIAGVAWQWSLASAARDEASSQRLLAESRFFEAKKTVDDYLAEVAGSGSLLSATPGTQSLRKELLTKAKDYYVSFTQTKPESEELKAQLADAYQSLGTISRELESSSETVEVLLESIDLREELIAADYDRENQLLAKVRTLNELAVAYDRIGDLPAAIEACDEVRKLINSGALRPTLATDLAYASALSTQGTALSRKGEDGPSEEVQIESVDFLAKLYQRDENRAAVTMTYVEALRRLAVTETLSGRMDAAREHLELALEVIENAHASEAPDAAAQGANVLGNSALEARDTVIYAATSASLARVYWGAGESDKAITIFRQCCDYLESIVQANPMVAQPIQILGNSYNQLAYYLIASSNDEALEIFEKSIPLLAQATENRPQDIEMLREFAEAYAMRGEYWLQQRASEKALEDIAQSIAINQRRRVLAPSNRDVIDLLIEGYKSQGILLRRLGRADEGAEAYRIGIGLIEELEAAGRASRETLVAKAGIYNNLAYLYQNTGQIEASLDPYEAAAELYGELAEGDSVRQEYYYQASSLTNKGSALGQLGRTEEGIEYLDRAVEMLETAMSKRTDNRMLLQFLFESYVYRAGLLDESGDFSPAKSDLEKALALPLEQNPFADLARLKLLAIDVNLGVVESSVQQAEEIAEGKPSDFYLEASRIPARAAVRFLEDEELSPDDRDAQVRLYAAKSASLIVQAMEKNQFLYINPAQLPQMSSHQRLWESDEYADVRPLFPNP